MKIVEQQIETTTPEQEVYSLGIGGVGVGGFYVSLFSLRLPLFLSGDYDEWRQFEVGEYLYCLARLRHEVLLVDTVRCLFSHRNFCFDEFTVAEQQLDFSWEIDATAKVFERLVLRYGKRSFWIYRSRKEVINVSDFKELVVSKL